jgi:hypothetical protein
MAHTQREADMTGGTRQPRQRRQQEEDKDKEQKQEQQQQQQPPPRNTDATSTAAYLLHSGLDLLCDLHAPNGLLLALPHLATHNRVHDALADGAGL